MEGYVQPEGKRQRSTQFQSDGLKLNEAPDMVFWFVFISGFCFFSFQFCFFANSLLQSRVWHVLSNWFLFLPPLVSYPALKTLESQSL